MSKHIHKTDHDRSDHPPVHVNPCRQAAVENPETLVDFWGDFIEWGGRRRGEAGFLTRQLKKPHYTRIFDSTLGDGCDTLYLLSKGYDVWANEIDPLFENKARENSQRLGIALGPITRRSWLHLDKEPRLKPASFDAVLCLGNSLTYLFTRDEQLTALRQFRRLLRRGGKLIIDERNYQEWLDEKERILAQRLARYSHRYVYIANEVQASPVFIDPHEVVIEYRSRNGRWARLHLYPFKRGEMHRLLAEAGFNSIRQYSDYRPEYAPKADFYHYVATSPA